MKFSFYKESTDSADRCTFFLLLRLNSRKKRHPGCWPLNFLKISQPLGKPMVFFPNILGLFLLFTNDGQKSSTFDLAAFFIILLNPLAGLDSIRILYVSNPYHSTIKYFINKRIYVNISKVRNIN
jgi:hypothetical protein